MPLGGFFRRLRNCAFGTELLDYSHLCQLNFDMNYVSGLEDSTLAEPQLRDLYMLASLYADALNLPRSAVREAVHILYEKEFLPEEVRI